MNFKNSSRVIVALFLMFTLYSCENSNSPTSTNQLAGSDLSTSTIQPLGLNKSIHEPNGLAPQGSSQYVTITNLTPNGTLNLPPGATKMNVGWSATATYTLPYATIPIWTQL